MTVEEREYVKINAVKTLKFHFVRCRVMTNRRKKRQRSKSSPKTLSTPKKYRQSVKSAYTANIDTDTDNTDSAVTGVSVSQEVIL